MDDSLPARPERRLVQYLRYGRYMTGGDTQAAALSISWSRQVGENFGRYLSNEGSKITSIYITRYVREQRVVESYPS